MRHETLLEDNYHRNLKLQLKRMRVCLQALMILKADSSSVFIALAINTLELSAFNMFKFNVKLLCSAVCAEMISSKFFLLPPRTQLSSLVSLIETLGNGMWRTNFNEEKAELFHLRCTA